MSDDLRIYDESNNEIQLTTEGITWPDLKGTKFSSKNTSLEWVDVESNRFINWMMPNTYPSTYKAWFRTLQPIYPGNYTFVVENGLDPSLFSGSKYFGFEDISIVGARNYITVLIVTVILLMSVSFTCIFNHLLGKEQLMLRVQQGAYAGAVVGLRL